MPRGDENHGIEHAKLALLCSAIALLMLVSMWAGTRVAAAGRSAEVEGQGTQPLALERARSKGVFNFHLRAIHLSELSEVDASPSPTPPGAGTGDTPPGIAATSSPTPILTTNAPTATLVPTGTTPTATLAPTGTTPAAPLVSTAALPAATLEPTAATPAATVEPAATATDGNTPLPPTRTHEPPQATEVPATGTPAVVPTSVTLSPLPSVPVAAATVVPPAESGEDAEGSLSPATDWALIGRIAGGGLLLVGALAGLAIVLRRARSRRRMPGDKVTEPLPQTASQLPQGSPAGGQQEGQAERDSTDEPTARLTTIPGAQRTTVPLQTQPSPDRPFIECAASPQLWFSLTKDRIRVGRDPESDLVIDEKYPGYNSVSRRHATLEWDGPRQRWIVVDQGSRNGVMVDGLRTGENVLRPGNSLKFGQVEFVFRRPPQEENNV